MLFRSVVVQRELLVIDLFVDVGANSGQTYSRVRKLGFSKSYLAIEPELSCFKALQSLQNEDTDLHCINSAIGDRQARVVLNVANNSALSSSLLTFSIFLKLRPLMVVNQKFYSGDMVIHDELCRGIETEALHVAQHGQPGPEAKKGCSWKKCTH